MIHQAARVLVSILVWSGLAVVPGQASDFAVEVIACDNTNSALWPDPQTVLGPPTVDTVGDGRPGGVPPVPLAIVPVYPAQRPSEIFRLGSGGFVTVRFDHPVEDDPLNPCGIDFIVFGNAFQQIGESKQWLNGDPNLTTINTAAVESEPGLVWVSQDGTEGSWRAFDRGPYADTGFPTLGRMYDPLCPEPLLPGNLWWGRPTDPTYPLNPALQPSDFVGMTVAGMAKRYGYSAGGTGFDLAQLDPPLRWIQYIRVEPRPDQGTPDIDAFADVQPRRFPDLDCDSDVDADDMAVLEACSTGPDIGPVSGSCVRADLDGDGDVDQKDFGILQACLRGPDELADLQCME